MRAAIYARFSSDKQKESSIEDQMRNGERRAAREGWAITHRYADRAISGTTAERPDYQQMLRDAKGKQFDVLLVDDFSHLSRDSVETEQARRRLVHWGLRVIGVSDGIATSQKGHKLQLSFKGMMNEVFIDELKDKIKRGMEGQAKRCYWNGGRLYGYRLVEVTDPTRLNQYGKSAKIGTRLEPDPEQARWVK